MLLSAFLPASPVLHALPRVSIAQPSTSASVHSSKGPAQVVPRAALRRRRAAPVDDEQKLSNSEDRMMAKRERVQAAMAEINRKYGPNTATFLDESNRRVYVDTFPSGSLTLDLILGGGLPRGRIVEIYGQESSGKTTLALHAIAEVQKKGGTAWVIDAEHALDMTYAKKLGVKTEDLVLCQAEEAEMALQLVDYAIRDKAADLVVIDSIPALIPSQELENDIGSETIGLLARLLSKSLRKYVNSAGRASCTIIMLNQLRQKINVGYGNPETTCGGYALRYYSSLRLEMRIIGRIKSPKEEDIGSRVKVTVVKSKVCMPKRSAEFDIMFGRGISHVGCVVDCAEDLGILTHKGSWYSYANLMKVQGRDNCVNFLTERRDICDELERLVRERSMQLGQEPGGAAEEDVTVGGYTSAEDEDDDSFLLEDDAQPAVSPL